MSGAKVGGETGTRVFPGSNLGGEGPQTGPSLLLYLPVNRKRGRRKDGCAANAVHNVIECRSLPGPGRHGHVPIAERKFFLFLMNQIPRKRRKEMCC